MPKSFLPEKHSDSSSVLSLSSLIDTCSVGTAMPQAQKRRDGPVWGLVFEDQRVHAPVWRSHTGTT